MASSLGQVLRIGAVVVGVPVVIVGAFAMYGKALTESEVAEGTLVSPEEARARAEAARVRFAAMTPAEHLDHARRALHDGYDPTTQTGGHVSSAEPHLAAIPASAPEHAPAETLRAEIAQRRTRLFGLAHQRVVSHLAEHGPVADPARQRVQRAALAREVDLLAGQGLGCVHVDGEADTTLRFDHGACNQAMLDAITPPAQHAALRGYGFRHVRCANGQATLALP